MMLAFFGTTLGVAMLFGMPKRLGVVVFGSIVLVSSCLAAILTTTSQDEMARVAISATLGMAVGLGITLVWQAITGKENRK